VSTGSSMPLIDLFQMPTPMKITGRASSITNAFINAIIPVVRPMDAEIAEALEILGMTEQTFRCAYCGDTVTEWDHLRPLIKAKMPTGYISEIRNLVPSCGKCNQSKGNKDWRTWIQSTAARSPAQRRIPDLERRIERLEAYEAWGKPTCLDFAQIVGQELWNQHQSNLQEIQTALCEAQKLAAQIRLKVRQAHETNRDI